MGRVSRYKKTKACFKSGLLADIWGEGDDGRRAKKRSKTSDKMRAKRGKSNTKAQGFDVAPSIEDDFDLSDMIVKKKHTPASVLAAATTGDDGNNSNLHVSAATTLSKTTTTTSGKTNNAAKSTTTSGGAIVPLNLDQELKDAKILAISSQKKNPPPTLVEPRKEGESKRAFAKRMKKETKQIISNETSLHSNRNPEKKVKKKEFLNLQKKKKKKGSDYYLGSNDNDDDDEYNDESILITGERAAAAAAQEPSFGEQAERPPTFLQLPRGAKQKAPPMKSRSIRKKGGGTLFNKDQIIAEQRMMEKMRERVQAQYAVVKAQRKRKGDFHL